MKATLHLVLLRIYRVLPTLPRRWVMRALAPKFTVGAICLIERPDGAVLLVRTVYRDNWSVPGGLLNRREHPADAAQREVLEEVGLRVELIGDPATVIDPRPQRIDFAFHARPASGEDVSLVRPCSPEIVEVRWFSREDLPTMQPETIEAFEALGDSD